MRLPRSAAAVLLAAVTTAGLVLGIATPAQAAPGDHYVALGDSYSSGVGAGGSGSCGRSNNAYPARWAAANAPASFTFAACSGATTSTVLSSQVSSLSTTTTLVSITIGGNDAGFANIMTTCVLLGTSSCVAAVQSAENFAQTTLPGRLDSVFSQIRTRAPNARVVVLSYPRFYQLNRPFCIGLSETSRAKINEGIDLLDGVLAAAAARHGFAFGDVRGRFVTHELCGSGSDWLNGLSIFSLSSSYHPNSSGHAGGYLPTFTSSAG